MEKCGPSKAPHALACVWLYSHPYLSGEWNLSISGMGFSMKARNVLPEGLILISVPWNLLPGLIDDLKDMEWDPEWFKLGRDGFIKAVRQLEQDIQKELHLKNKIIHTIVFPQCCNIGVIRNNTASACCWRKPAF